jgi:anhydro-N-acetylmuramic acid kinase
MLFPELPYDVDGALARRGRVCEGVVRELLAEPYFAAPPPKSTGRELFTRAYMERLIVRCRAERNGVVNEDIIATAVELTAQSIADAFRRFVPEPVAEVVISGGGARNPAVVDALVRHLAPARVARFDDLFFDGDAKEAVAFALMGYLFVEGRTGNVPGATGARGRRMLGKWSPA